MDNTFIFSLIVGTLVGATAAYLGSLMVSRRMALVGDALGHVAFPGMGIALVWGYDPSIGAFVFLMFGISIIWALGEVTLLSSETVVGIVFVTSLALGFLIVPQHEILESLIGDISEIDAAGVITALLVSAIVLVLVRRIFKGMILLNLSAELAQVEGFSARKYNFIYLFCIALVVALGVKVTGSLLVGALVILPSATSRVITTNLKSYVSFSVFFGIASCVIGVILSHQLNIASGPAIILTGSFLFLGALIYNRLFQH